MFKHDKSKEIIHFNLRGKYCKAILKIIVMAILVRYGKNYDTFKL